MFTKDGTHWNKEEATPCVEQSQSNANMSDDDENLRNGDDRNPGNVHLSTRTTKLYRQKLLETVFLGLVYISIGLNCALTGSTFLDLLLITDSDVEDGSSIFISAGIGYCVGSLISGFLYDRFPRKIVLICSVLLTGILTASIPWCSVLPLLVAVKLLETAAMGSADTGLIVLVVQIWQQNVGPYMQALHLCYAVGGILGPIIAEPFLAKRVEDHNHTNLNLIETRTAKDNIFNIVYNGTHSDLIFSYGSRTFINETEDQLFIFPQRETKIYIPYFLAGIFSCLVAAPFLWVYLKLGRDRNSESYRESDNPLNERKIPDFSLRPKIILLVCLGIFYLLYNGSEDGLPNYMMAFVVKQFNWHKTNGALVTSVFWGSFTAGRALGIGIARCLSPFKMILICLISLNISYLILIIVAPINDVAVWYLAPLFGAFMGPIYPGGFTLTNRYIIVISGKVSSYLTVCSSAGNVLTPILLGYLFKHVTAMWYLYLALCECTAGLMIIMLIRLLVIKLRQ